MRRSTRLALLGAMCLLAVGMMMPTGVVGKEAAEAGEEYEEAYDYEEGAYEAGEYDGAYEGEYGEYDASQYEGEYAEGDYEYEEGAGEYEDEEVADAAAAEDEDLDEMILENVSDEDVEEHMEEAPEHEEEILEEILEEAKEAEPQARVEPERPYNEENRQYPLNDIPPPLPGVFVFSSLKDVNESTVRLGKDVDSQVTFTSELDEPLHIWGIMGSLNFPDDFGQYVQNFSYSIVNVTLPAKKEFSMIYTFQPFDKLEPRSYQLALTLFYEKAAAVGIPYHSSYAATYFNETVVLDYPEGSVTNQTFYALIFVAALAAIGIFGGYKAFQNYQKKSRSARVETGTRTTVEADWVSEHEQMVTGGGRAKSTKKEQ